MRADAIADTLHESNKSLTRYNDDEDLEAMRKAAIRDGDPMAEYIARKKQKEKGNEKGDYFSSKQLLMHFLLPDCLLLHKNDCV